MVRFAKWRAGDSYEYICVPGHLVAPLLGEDFLLCLWPYSWLRAALVPASLCCSKQMAMSNTDENSHGRQCGLQLIIRYSTSGEQNLETSLILDIAHQLLLTKRHTPSRLVLPEGASLFCRCMENPASSILSVSSFSHNSVKHKMLQFLMSRWQDNLNCRPSILFSNDCTLPRIMEGNGSLLSRLRILRRVPDLWPLFQRLFFMQKAWIWACSSESRISFSSDSLKENVSSSPR